jgi:lipoprotein-releasing system permease protein
VINAYEWLIGTRYLSGARRQGFISFVALMSVFGLMLGVAVLIVVLSVMNGFERELRSRILSVTSHATITGLQGSFPDWQAARAKATQDPQVLAAVPFIDAQAILSHGQHVVGAQIRGVVPELERTATGLAQKFTQGTIEQLQAGSFHIVLGSALAAALNAKVGDSVFLIAPEATATPSGLQPRMRRFWITGIFSSGMYEYDRALALIEMHDAARIYRMGDNVSGLRLALRDPWRAPTVVADVARNRLGGGFYVSDWTRSHENFFRSITVMKSILFVILLMIVAVAAFNIIATLVMIVKEKRSEIAILRTLGAGPANMLGTFAIQGVLIGLTGTVLGAALGVLVAHNLENWVHDLEHLLGTHFLDASVYNMSDLPAYVEIPDVLRVCAVAFALCVLATLYPAWRASRTAPAEALRHD